MSISLRSPFQVAKSQDTRFDYPDTPRRCWAATDGRSYQEIPASGRTLALVPILKDCTRAETALICGTNRYTLLN